MKKFTAVNGNGSTFNYIAEYFEVTDTHFHFIVDGKIIGALAKYSIVSVSDQPYNQKYVR